MSESEQEAEPRTCISLDAYRAGRAPTGTAGDSVGDSLA